MRRSSPTAASAHNRLMLAADADADDIGNGPGRVRRATTGTMSLGGAVPTRASSSLQR